MAKKLRWSKAALGEWHGRLSVPDDQIDKDVARVVAIAAKTGSHLDNHPWDWYFTTYGTTLVPDTLRPCSKGDKCDHNPRVHMRRHAGVTDTLRDAKEAVEACLTV